MPLQQHTASSDTGGDEVLSVEATLVVEEDHYSNTAAVAPTSAGNHGQQGAVEDNE